MVAAPQRQTRQRAAIADLLSRTDQFRTASQIHDDLRHEGEDIGLTTVYRTLLMMANAGQVDLIRTGEGETAYRRCSMGITTTSSAVTADALSRSKAPLSSGGLTTSPTNMAFSDIQHHLGIFGRCSSCADQSRP